MSTYGKGLQFMFSIPTNIVFGMGTLGTVGARAKDLGFHRPLIVTDKIMSKSDGMKQLLATLSEAGLEGVVWDGIAAEPIDTTLTEGVQRYRADRCDGLIGFGGGSAMDTAKGVGVLAVSGDDDPTPYQRGGSKAVPGCVPVIAIPTTAGTGSEVTSVAVILDERKKQKILIVENFNTPRIAILDPKMTEKLPPLLTASTGMDALTHAVEALQSLQREPIADAALVACRVQRRISAGWPSCCGALRSASACSSQVAARW